MGCNASERKDEPAKGSITTNKQFFEAISKGAKLVVLENSVIDVSKFASMHPGGAEVINKYVGKSLSIHIFRHGN